MTTIGPDSREDAAFSVAVSLDSKLVEIRFVHSGGPAHNAIFRAGYLSDGWASAGDGVDLGEVTSDFVVGLFDPTQVDRSTIETDFPIEMGAGRQAAIFMTWGPRPTSAQTVSVGIEVTCDTDGVFRASSVMSPEEAMAFMVKSKMAQTDEFSNSVEARDSNGGPFTVLSVSGYRGFAEQRYLHLAQPKGIFGSGLTILVGANNSGKSTFLEAFHFLAQSRRQRELSFPQPRRHRHADSVQIEIERADGRRLRVATLKAGSSQAGVTWSPTDAGPDKFDIHVTPSRRQFSPYFGNTGSVDRDWGLSDQEFSRTQLREHFVGRLRKVDRDPESRRIFDLLLDEIIGGHLDWTFDEIATGQQFLKLIEPDGAWHTSEGLGDGLVSLLFIVDALYDSKPGSLVAIDEPELSLHPQLVRRLRKVLSRFASDRQIVVATHSPLIVDWQDVSNGATVARVYKIGGRSEIAQASPATLKSVAELTDTRNLANPHTVGTVAREAFFLEDGVILTEGQEDVAYLPRVLEDLGIPVIDNFYGWGSGGVGNIPKIAQLFRELGFRKIGAILDDDQQPSTIAALEKLRLMSPEVLAVQIPAPDIRFKKRSDAKSEVVGLLDPNNQVRPELRNSAATVLQKLLGHVS